MQRFESLAGNANTKFYFDVTEISEVVSSNTLKNLTKLAPEQVGAMGNSTQWEFNPLYNKFPEKFKETMFYFKGTEYKGNEIFNIK